MKKFAKLVKSVLFLTFVLLMTNCAPNEAEESSNVQAVDEAKNWYNIHKEEFNSPVLEYVSDLKWENAIISDGIDGLVVEVPFTLTDNLRTSNGQGNLYNDHHRLVFIKNEPNNFKTYYVQIFTDNKNSSSLDKSYSYYAMKENYNGKVFVQDLITNKTNVLEFKNGEQSKPSSTSKWREEFYDCTFLGWIGEDGSFEPIKLLYCDGGSGSGDGGPTYGGGVTTGGGGGTGGTSPTSATQIFNNLTGKAKCLNDLLDYKGNSFVQNLLSNFEGTSKFDISISSKDVVMGIKNGVEREINGRTLPPEGNLIKIEISTSMANSKAPLEVARVILHEYIHADIYRKLGINLGTDKESLDFKTTYEKYKEHHSTIATLYINSMKEALKEFHQSLFPADISAYTAYWGEAPNDEFYEALAWGGLQDSDVRAWNELSPAKQASIISLAKRVEQFSKNSPCNN